MKIKNRIQIKNQLESYYGIGKTQSKAICNLLGISSNLRINKLTQYEKNQIMLYLRKRIKIIENPISQLTGSTGVPQQSRKTINLLPIGENLKFIKKNSIGSLIQKNSYRGSRLKRGLPVRGQRTHTNAQTCKKLSRNWK